MDPVAVCNVALGLVGFQPIASLDDQLKHAQLCKTIFPSLLDAVLEERQWTFAIRRLELAAEDLDDDEKAALAPWTRRFTVPATVARVLSCDDGSGCNRVEWQLEGEGIVVLEDIDKLYARVLVKGDQVERFSPAFEQVLATRLAAEIAVPLAENAALAARLWALYERKLAEAGTLDGMQGRAEQSRSNYFRDRRR